MKFFKKLFARKPRPPCEWDQPLETHGRWALGQHVRAVAGKHITKVGRVTEIRAGWLGGAETGWRGFLVTVAFEDGSVASYTECAEEYLELLMIKIS